MPFCPILRILAHFPPVVSTLRSGRQHTSPRFSAHFAPVLKGATHRARQLQNITRQQDGLPDYPADPSSLPHAASKPKENPLSRAPSLCERVILLSCLVLLTRVYVPHFVVRQLFIQKLRGVLRIIIVHILNEPLQPTYKSLRVEVAVFHYE